MRLFLVLAVLMTPAIAAAQTPSSRIAPGDASQDRFPLHADPQGGNGPETPPGAGAMRRDDAPGNATNRRTVPDDAPRLAGDLQPAPVPATTPPTSQTGAPSAIPERISPPGVGNNIAGPANATPFSSTPSANMPQGGAGAIVPNTSK